MSLPRLPDVPRERRRTATVVAVGVFALLCVLALALGLKGLLAPAGGGSASGPASSSRAAQQGSGSPSAPSDTSSTTSSTAATTSTPSDLVGFSSPSGNIRCQISSAQARCDIASRTWQPTPKPADCSGDWGRGLQLSAAGAGFVCASDAAAGGSPLAYGASIARGDLRCDSAKDGVTCVHTPSGHAFSVARASYTLR